jgi:hypothetical protein
MVRGGVVVVRVVARLEVKQPLALVAANERLVAVVAQALTSALQLFRRRETAELSYRRWRSGSGWGLCPCRRWQCRASSRRLLETLLARRVRELGWSQCRTAEARSTKAQARCIAVGKSCGARSSTSTVM